MSVPSAGAASSWASALRATWLCLCVFIGGSLGQAQTPAAGERNLQVQAVPAASNGTAAQRRIALVIGNAAYKEAPLLNPVNDARAIAQALKESGFTVITRENADQRAMLLALREFGDQLRSGGGTGLFYFAGHGVQIKGRNYLIPLGASIEREDEVAYGAVDAQAVLDKMEAAGNVANIMILDACRNNPFVRSSRGGPSGLAQMDAPVGTLVAYATSPGMVANDGAGANGLYTQHLLAAIRQPNSKVEDVFKQVRTNVRRDSQGKQVPWESTSLEGDFYFRGGAAPPTAAPPDAALEAALWDAVKGSNLAVELRAYLNRFPNGRFAPEALARIARLQAPQAPPPAAAAPANTPPVARADPALGFMVGDTWTFELDDQLNKKKNTFTHTVSAISSDGDASINNGGLVYTAAGRPRYQRSNERERFYSESARTLPSQWRVGFKEPIAYEIRSKYTSGREALFTLNGELEVVAREKVTTPAGAFMAWRFLRKGVATFDGKGLRVEYTAWFVPELRRSVVQDTSETSSTSGQPTVRERITLQSFQLADPAAMAAVRTNMAEAASGAAPPPATTVAAAASNPTGFTVGDRWRYQVVDKFKGEVVRNYGVLVEKIQPDNSLVLNQGNLRWDAAGNLQFSRSWDRERIYSPEYHLVPPRLVAGAKTPMNYSIQHRFADGRTTKEVVKGTLLVKGEETVRTPAGEFKAWRVEIDAMGSMETVNDSGFRWAFVGWYVPELRAYVAYDDEARNSRGSLTRRDRHELTSFQVRGAEHLAQR